MRDAVTPVSRVHVTCGVHLCVEELPRNLGNGLSKDSQKLWTLAAWRKASARMKWQPSTLRDETDSRWIRPVLLCFEQKIEDIPERRSEHVWAFLSPTRLSCTVTDTYSLVCGTSSVWIYTSFVCLFELKWKHMIMRRLCDCESVCMVSNSLLSICLSVGLSVWQLTRFDSI